MSANVVSRRAIDRARTTQRVYRAAMAQWLRTDSDADLRVYHAAFAEHVRAVNELNEREDRLFRDECRRNVAPARLGLN